MTICFDNFSPQVVSLEAQRMARILSDHQIKKLFGSVLHGADERLLNPNGIELRLGQKVSFISTSEEKDIPDGHFIKVGPGETVIISSLEKIDIRKETIQSHFPKCMLMAFITPTTTMVREGIMQAATKVDAGYNGNLNWGFRNGSYKDFIMQQGEPLFKLTFFLLEGDEVPNVNYGDRPEHKYQGTEGIKGSVRRLPVNIPKNKVVSSSFEKLDPKKQLSEAGAPFSYIGTELLQLQGKWEVVDTGVKALHTKIDETKNTLLDKVETIFQQKFIWAVTVVVGSIPTLYGILGFIRQKTVLTPGNIYFIAIGFGVLVLLGGWFLFLKKDKVEK